MATPTLQEYWNASNAAYNDDGEGAKADSTPPLSTGLTLLLDSTTVNKSWLSDGFFAQAFVDTNGNVIIAYEGSILSSSDQSSYAKGSRSADVTLAFGGTPKAYQDALTFYNDVKAITTAPLYITGHSLGGGEAEYVAAHTHANGVTFGAPGTLFQTYPKPPQGESFVNYVDYGDPIGNFGSHYGTVTKVGPVSDGRASNATLYHPLVHYAADLNLKTSSIVVAALTSLGSDATPSGTNHVFDAGLANSATQFVQAMASFGAGAGGPNASTFGQQDEHAAHGFLAAAHA